MQQQDLAKHLATFLCIPFFFSSWFMFFKCSFLNLEDHYTSPLNPLSKGVLGPSRLPAECWPRVWLTHALESWVWGCWDVVAITLAEFGNSSSSLTPRVLILANYSSKNMIQCRWLIWKIRHAWVFDNEKTENFCIGVAAANNSF